MKSKKIAAIIACYKDEKAIPIMYERLKKVFRLIPTDYEIIFVNDGSPDNSDLVLATIAFKDSHVVVINHSRNFSSQMAFTSGMLQTNADAIILLDGDLQDPPELIEKFYKKWIEGYDVVYGVRIKREAPFFMQLAYKTFYRIFHSLSYIEIPVDAGDFSLIDKKIVKVLNSMPERDRFLRGLRAWSGFKQTGVPYVRPERLFGRTTNSLIKNIQWATKGIFSFSYIPLQFITIVTFFVCILSFLGIIYQVIIKLLDPTTPQGITTVLIVMLFLGAVQLLGISILGEYIGKIFEETKHRPLFVVKNIIRDKKNIDMI